MDAFIAGQIIGLCGYGLCMAAPQFHAARPVIRMDMMACGLLAVQWLLLAQPALLLVNLMVITASALSLASIEPVRKQQILMGFYPLAMLLILMIWEGTLIDVLAIGALFCIIASRRTTQDCNFRLYCFTGALVLALSGALAGAILAAFFNLCCAFGHAQKLCTPLFRQENSAFQAS